MLKNKTMSRESMLAALEQNERLLTKNSKSRGRRMMMWLALIVAVTSLGMNAQGTGDDADKNDAETTAAVAKDKTENNADDKKIVARDASKDSEIVRLIPDQKVYVGSPAMTINLESIFGHTASAEIAEGVYAEITDIKVIRNKKEKVAAAEIEGNNLNLKWSKIGKTEISIMVTYANGKSVRNTFNVKVWEADYLTLIFTVIGGLGIFLLGMKNMSEGLQAVAGSGLRRMISLATDNRILATLVGVLMTCVVQSSSITTVMVVGFVNSGFMTLSQAIGVVMGANIGTTVTGWILVLKIGKYGLPILGVGAFGYLFSRRDRVRFISMFIMGLGMVFLGLELMKNGFSIIKDLPAFEAWFREFSADTYFGVLKCAAIGCILTFIVQSSSATLGITIGLAQIGVIEFETAAALVMGENIGTTITAWLASFGTTTNAKRAAYFHVIFNLVGVAWITAIFSGVYLPMLKSVLWGSTDHIVTTTEATTGIAMAHSGFNIVNTLLFLPFAGMIGRLLERYIPDRVEKEKPHLTSLDIRMLETPVLAIEQSRNEVLRMAEGCDKMMGWSREVLGSEEPDEAIIQKIFHREEVLDTVHDEVVHFMTDLLAGTAPHDIVDEARRQLRMVDEYESVSDYVTVIVKSHLKLTHAGLKLPSKARDDLNTIHKSVTEYLSMVHHACKVRQAEVVTKARSQGEAITRHIKELRDQFLMSMSEERINPFVGVAFNAQLNGYRRVRDHTMNIAEALAGEK